MVEAQNIGLARANDAPTRPLRLFLSYAHVDKPAVARLAASLERAGHSVWWDQNLEGGTAFATEIERELEQADVVIVAWSARAATSHWVLDEAATARDRGRLLPVLLDGTMPPLGFRQIQALDLVGWTGRDDAPAIATVLRGIQVTAGKGDTAASATLSAHTPRTHATTSGRRLSPLLITIALLLLAVAAFGLWQWQGGSSRAMATKVAVLPFQDLSPRRDQAYFAQGIAEEILNTLAREPRLKVLGRFSAAALANRLDELGNVRNTLGITDLLEGSVRSDGDRLRIDVRLIDTRDGSERWSQRYERASGDVFAIQDEIARSVTGKLLGQISASTTTANTHRTTRPELYARFLAARGLLRTRERQRIAQARTMLEEIVRADPDYSPALAQLAASYSLLHFSNFGTLSTSEVGALVQPVLQRLADIDPQLPDAELARGHWLALQSLDAIPTLERAVALDPQSADALQVLAVTRTFDIRPDSLTKALAEARRANAIDPLWFRPVWAMTDALSGAGKLAEVRDLVRGYTQIAPSIGDALKLEAHAAYAIADPVWLANTLKRLQAAGVVAVLRGYEPFAADAWLFAQNRLVGDPGVARLPEHLRSWVLNQPAPLAARVAAGDVPMFDEYNAGAVASWSLFATGRGADLNRLYHERFSTIGDYAALGGKWYRTTGNLAWSLRAAGFGTEASAMTDVFRQQLEARRKAGKTEDYLALTQYELLAGNPAAAVSAFTTGANTAPRLVCLGPVTPDSLPWFAPLKAQPQVMAALASCRTFVSKARVAAGLGT